MQNMKNPPSKLFLIMTHPLEKIHIPGLYFHKLGSLPPCRPAFFRVSWPTPSKPVLVPGYQLIDGQLIDGQLIDGQLIVLQPPRCKSRLHNPLWATGTGLFQTEQFVACKTANMYCTCKFKKMYYRFSPETVCFMLLLFYCCQQVCIMTSLKRCKSI
jgi:hypothetical protein